MGFGSGAVGRSAAEGRLVSAKPVDLRAVYAGRRVLVTGHTGFKGSWLALWLSDLGAEVFGLALAPETHPSLFQDAALEGVCRHRLADVRDLAAVRAAVDEARPDLVFHLAAQALVRVSYKDPVGTLSTNVLGTAHLLEAVRVAGRPCAVVVVTSDKCYENREWAHGYREEDPLGGHDVYSSSKGAAELVTTSYRRSFFPPERLREHGVAVASARAGNVIGGGDWSRDRVVPDIVRALDSGASVVLRSPRACRPWQHVLEPLGGYLLLGSRLVGADGADAAGFCGPWNFGPDLEGARTVSELTSLCLQAWGEGGTWREEPAAGDGCEEAGLLRLSIDKAVHLLGWSPRWNLEEAVRRTMDWYRQHLADPGCARRACLDDIRAYCEA